MKPRIGRSIAQGFRAANRSLAGIVLYAVGLLGIVLLVTLGVVSTNPPAEVFQQPPTSRLEFPELSAEEARAQEVPEAATETGTEAETAPAPEEPAPEGPAPEEPAPEAPAPVGEGEVSLFEQLETAGDEAPLAPPVELPTAPADAREAAQIQAEEQARVVRDWVGRAWPMLAVCLLIAVCGNLWLTGGQIGYIAKQVTAPPAPVSEFWRAGTRAFLPLVGASLIALAGLAGILGIIILVTALLALLPDAAGTALGVAVGLVRILVGLGIAAVLVWLIVRLVFWFIVIVADRRGPIRALATSFRSTRGHWWRLAGLVVVLVLISYAVWVPFALLEWVGSVLGGGAALALGILGNVGGAIAGLYVGFAALGAYVRFYEDTKSAPAPAAPAAAPVAP